MRPSAAVLVLSGLEKPGSSYNLRSKSPKLELVLWKMVPSPLNAWITFLFALLELKEAEEAVEEGLAKIEELEQKLFELGGEIGAGRQIPPGTRVLTLKDNPAQREVDLRQATLGRLKGENEALLEKLVALRSGRHDANVASADFVPKESWEVMKTENAELMLALEHKGKRIRRLQEVLSSNLAFHIN